MLLNIMSLKYYVIILIAVVLLKVLFVILNRVANAHLNPPAGFFLITLVFSYLGLTGGFIASYVRQPAITIAVLATLFFIFGTMAVILNDRNNRGFDSKIGTYFILLISITMAIGSGTDNFKRKKPEDIDAKNTFQHEVKMEKNKASLKKSEQAFVLYQSM
jgi:hypothetical protein